MNIFNEIVTLCIINSEITFNVVLSAIVFLAMVDSIHEFTYPGGIPVKREERAGFKFKSYCYFAAMWLGNVFFYFVVSLAITSFVLIIHHFTA